MTGGDAPVVVFLRDLGIDTAEEFHGLDLTAVQEVAPTMLDGLIGAERERRKGALVKRLRTNPPQPGQADPQQPFSAADFARYRDDPSGMFRLDSDTTGLDY